MASYVKSGSLAGAVVCVTIAGCGAMNAEPASGTGVTQQLREACPTLTDEVIEGFILAISGLRDNGLSEADALEQWVDGCGNIPPDGNFQGDAEACRLCLPVIVEEAYEDVAPG